MNTPPNLSKFVRFVGMNKHLKVALLYISITILVRKGEKNLRIKFYFGLCEKTWTHFVVSMKKITYSR